jgi:hypothetical protein
VHCPVEVEVESPVLAEVVVAGLELLDWEVLSVPDDPSVLVADAADEVLVEEASVFVSVDVPGLDEPDSVELDEEEEALESPSTDVGEPESVDDDDDDDDDDDELDEELDEEFDEDEELDELDEESPSTNFHVTPVRRPTLISASCWNAVGEKSKL